MLTQCPHCATVFPIEADALQAASGWVQCGVCDREFDALERLRRAAPQGEPTPRLDPELAERQGDLFEAPPAAPATVPNFAQPAPPHVPASTRWWLLAASLGLLLALQIFFEHRYQWAESPRWRATYEQACEWVGCSLPVWRQPRAWTLLTRDISPHPSVGDALLVTATLRNDAEWPQPAPVVELAMTDIDGQTIALRRFRPNEYLPDTQTQKFAPGQSVLLRLELVDPDKMALAYSFEFL
ncbi:zinc-ribbon and DUF3426 domain-containing protein [Pseudomarimonas arenosa]|uniref:Zinc-ribbon domain-containing protein n=1 Tax=Pseudomarimonas arenosa TaxID=2774145 RepID=A0AAW3ZPJ6_9GAMM|nr:zinc-ribbon and DUF3426 domain-containing protein [Pseudomarimonas arenosa]MBD8528090.1 zinc-ribbon domain-containing protein [Pseudomarimonas arenosa]